MNEIAPIRKLSLTDFSRVPMTASAAGWWNEVPAKPGWYAIETDAPVSTLQAALSPREVGKRYNLAARVTKATFLIERGLAITPTEPGSSYVVYAGEHANLKSRAREHTHGNKGTGCLCLSQYADIGAFQWTFNFLSFERHVPGHSDNKLLRTLLEQKWRAENGWPVLCAE